MNEQKLPDIRMARAPDWQHERLARWLAEWRIELALGETPTAGRMPAPLRAEVRAELGGDTGMPEAGHIRLLYPHLAAAWHRPVCLAILAQRNGPEFLAAPFGPFSEPATPGELRTGRAEAPLRVLCVWNARWFTPTVFRGSWKVDTLTGEDLEAANRVLAACEDGLVLPAELAGRVGPPLMHPDDPRRIYCRRETVRMDALLRDSGTVYDAGTLRYPDTIVRELPRAAERGDDGPDPDSMD